MLLLFEVIDPPRMLDQALRAADGLPGILSARPSGSGASPAGSSPRRHAGKGQPVGYSKQYQHKGLWWGLVPSQALDRGHLHLRHPCSTTDCSLCMIFQIHPTYRCAHISLQSSIPPPQSLLRWAMWSAAECTFFCQVLALLCSV